MTVLLTGKDAGLIGALRRRRPDLNAMAIGTQVPESAPPGPLWCFVDWLLPDISGLEMCRRLREARATRDSHITMVLEEGDIEAQRRALRAGADDYLVGPLDPDRLEQRISQYGVTPAASSAAGRRLAHGGLTIDPAAFAVRFHGRPLALRPNEFQLLSHFVAHPDQVFSRTSLIEHIGKDSAAIDERTVDVWVGRLRRALTAQGVPDPLRTVRSMGYVLDSL